MHIHLKLASTRRALAILLWCLGSCAQAITPTQTWHNYGLGIPDMSTPDAVCATLNVALGPSCGAVPAQGGSVYTYSGVVKYLYNTDGTTFAASCGYSCSAWTDNVGNKHDAWSNTFSAAYPVWMCPAGTAPSGNTCTTTDVDPNLNKGGCCTSEGNPINPLVGNKHQTEYDYSGAGSASIQVVRTYNSFGAMPGSPVGAPATSSGHTTWSGFSASGPLATVGTYTHVPIDSNWRLNYDRSLVTLTGSINAVTLYRPDSKTRTFTMSGSAWVPDDGQLKTSLTQQVDGSGNITGYTYVNENDETEKYDTSGRLSSITSRAGMPDIEIQQCVQHTEQRHRCLRTSVDADLQ